MKIRILVLYLLTASSLAMAESKLTEPDPDNLQKSETSESESADSADEGGDRGFDPCLLNASLAICQKQ